MNRICHSRSAFLGLRVLTCGLSAFVGIFLALKGQDRPCMSKLPFKFHGEEKSLMISAISIAIATPFWMMIRRRNSNILKNGDCMFDVFAFFLLFLPAMYWGNSHAATISCGIDPSRQEQSAKCYHANCEVIRISMSMTFALLLLLICSFSLAFHQSQPPPPVLPIQLNKTIEADSLTNRTPQDHFLEILTPTTEASQSTVA